MSTKFYQLISQEMVFLDIEPFKNKDELFLFLAKQLKKQALVNDEIEFIQALQEREKIGSTYMGNSIALPHGKSSTVNRESIIMCRFKKPFLYQTIEGVNKVDLLFMIAVPESQENNQYLKLLASLASLLVHSDYVEEIMKINNYHEMIKITKKYI